MIDISGLSKVDVLCALHDATSPQGMGFLHAVRGGASREAAEHQLSLSHYVDYFLGRPIKVNLTGDEFNEGLFDRDAGKGAAASAIAKLRAT